MMDIALDLPVMDPFTDEYAADPHAAHHTLRALSPVVRHPFGYGVLGYHEVQTVLRDRRLVMPPAFTLSAFGVTSGRLYNRALTSILSLDGDDHARLRRLVAQAFTPRVADTLRAAIRTLIGEALDAASDDLDVVDVVRTYPIGVICALLGVDRQHWDFISDTTDTTFRMFLPTVAAEQHEIMAAIDRLDDFVDDLVAERHRDGLTGDDLITLLIRAEEDGDRLTRAELQSLVGTLLGAGTDTTRNQLAAAVHTFAAHPDQWALLRKRPELIPRAVDEVMRYCPVTLGTLRQATTDIDLAGVTIPIGSMVWVGTSAANRDPAVFTDPDRFDITRSVTAPQLTFGGGIHYCLGVHLAKAELTEGLSQMARRWQAFEPTGPARWKEISGVSGPITLPIRVRRA